MERLREKKSLLPNMITYINLFLGVVAIIHIDKSIKLSILLVLLCGFTDKLDGYVARRLDAVTDFGKELDSLSDMVSFGLAPALIGWELYYRDLNFFGLALIGGYIGAGAFRLARYNITGKKDYIRGLPITISGMILVFKYYLDIYFLGLNSHSITNNVFLIFFLSFLMVSRFKVKKPKIIDESLF